MDNEREKLLRKLLEGAEASSMYRVNEILRLEDKLKLTEEQNTDFYDLVLLYFELGLKTGLTLSN